MRNRPRSAGEPEWTAKVELLAAIQRRYGDRGLLEYLGQSQGGRGAWAEAHGLGAMWEVQRVEYR